MNRLSAAGTLDRHVVWRTFLNDTYRTKRFRSKRSAIVVDVGAQIGSFSVQMAPHADRILAFEPVPENYALLDENVSAQGYAHVETFPLAVSDRPGSVRIFLSQGNTAGHGMVPPKDPSGGYVDVEAVRLPDILDARGIREIDLLKLDCEGAEYGILESLVDWGLDRIHSIAMEYHLVHADTPETHSGEGAQAILEGAGFRLERIPHRRNPGQGMIFADRPRSDATASGVRPSNPAA